MKCILCWASDKDHVIFRYMAATFKPDYTAEKVNHEYCYLSKYQSKNHFGEISLANSTSVLCPKA